MALEIKRRCRNCGATLTLKRLSDIVSCKFCDTKNDYSVCSEEEKNLLDEVSKLRNEEEFDSADEMCKKILEINEENYLAKWERVLCRYGVAYVDSDEDPDIKLITCRKSLESEIKEDEDFQWVLKKASIKTAADFRKKGNTISEIQSKIRAGKKTPWDVFICYKETDNGCRTMDSYHAELICDFLESEGYKVFYARKTLEGMLGADYEATIFNAIANAKVMLVLGSKKTYFYSKWVKSEWKRFLVRKQMDSSKQIIPVYENINPSIDLPEEIRKNQAVDMYWDEQRCYGLLRENIRKLIGSRSVGQAVTSSVPNIQYDEKLNQANKLYEEAEYDEAEAAYEKKKRTSAEALFHLGSMYYTIPEKMDEQEAFNYIKKAADKKYPEAMYQMGFFYEMGIGVKPDTTTAKDWYRKYDEICKKGTSV